VETTVLAETTPPAPPRTTAPTVTLLEPQMIPVETTVPERGVTVGRTAVALVTTMVTLQEPMKVLLTTRRRVDDESR